MSNKPARIALAVLLGLSLERGIAQANPLVHQTIGRASFYGYRFAGRRTASGVIYNPQAMTAASRTLPFGTRVLVTNLANGRSAVVTINDRGPYVRGRDIDVSVAVADKLGMRLAGVVEVAIQILKGTEQ